MTKKLNTGLPRNHSYSGKLGREVKIPENGKQFMSSTPFGLDTLRNIKSSEHMQ